MTVETHQLAQTSVRVEPGTEAYARVGAAFGLTLPTSVGVTATGGPHTALWLGPDEWLVVTETGPAPDLAGLLRPGERGLVTDVSAARVVLTLAGPTARQVLESGCPADLHPRSFAPGRAITTTLARVPLLLWQTDPDAYRLLPRTSHAAYVACWLADAARSVAPTLLLGTVEA